MLRVDSLLVNSPRSHCHVQSFITLIAFLQDERQPAADETPEDSLAAAEEAAKAPASAEGLTTDAAWQKDTPGSASSSGSGSQPSPHSRLAEAYAHLSTSADAQDHQVQIESYLVNFL